MIEAMNENSRVFLRHSGAHLPIICGPMYPCSNPELVAAVSAHGGLGVVQPISLTYVYGYDLRQGLRYIKSLTERPIGMNALIEKSSATYHKRMQVWLDIALEEGVRFFITSLGKPDWVVKKVHDAGGFVYHDATESKWARIGKDCGVDGIIAVNRRAGGHPGRLDAADLYTQLRDLNLPLICAGGIGAPKDFQAALNLGYAGVQMGTRFIASLECKANRAYKDAIVRAQERDIVLSERITGVPVAIIRTPYVERIGLKGGAFARWMLRGGKTKYLMRTLYALKSMWQLKKSSVGENSREYWQAGKSVVGIDNVLSVADIIHLFAGEIAVNYEQWGPRRS